MKRIRDYGIIIGNGKTGKLNKITDISGVKVGHYTLQDGKHNTGITVILPCEDNPFINKVMATSHVINGYGKTQGLVQVEELGYIETPIVLTSTLNVGKLHDSVVSYMIERSNKENEKVLSINPVVGEVNDSPLNDVQDRPLGEKELREAINNAKIDFEEGSIGGGTGTVCSGVKGGIGSSSRITIIDGKIYTIGVLVQTNYGGVSDLVIDGVKVGEQIKDKLEKIEDNKGSIMIVVATDLPVSERQLKRIIKRTEVGLVRTGSTIGNDSGDVVIGFTTANRLNKVEDGHIREYQSITEDKINYVFKQVADATEEAILNSLATAKTTSYYKGKTRYSLTDIYLNDYWKNKNFEALIEDFPVQNQFPDYPVGCESVALYTLLKYHNVDVTIEDIVNNLKKGERPHYEGETMYGGDPEIEFLGDPKDVYSYGVYEKPIEEVANKFKSGIKNISGTSFKDILELVKNGYPVQVWSSINCLEPKYANHSWIDRRTNKEIKWKQPFHSLVVIGYSNDKVVVSDPDSGSIREFDRQKFENAYNFFGKRALYYEE
ncbi:MAG: P1 family peptidase [Bacilli bacterium]|nr:P1 family peptidase [Bacilli bacterium]